jgi:hypothetical protein
MDPEQHRMELHPAVHLMQQQVLQQSDMACSSSCSSQARDQAEVGKTK